MKFKPATWSLDFFEQENVSVFESVRGYGGILFHWEEHLARLYRSAKTVGLPLLAKPAELTALVNRTLKESGQKNAFLRLTATAQGVFVTVGKRDYPSWVYERGVRVRTTPVRKNLSRAFYPEAKSSSYGSQVLGTLEMRPDDFELFFLSEEGTVRETRTSNVFMIKEGVLSTPSLVGILEGVTRKTVMEIARGMLEVRETDLTRHDLFNAEEIFLTHTSGEIIPVREVDGRTIGGKVPGIWVRRLRKSFQREVSKYKKTIRLQKDMKRSE